MSDKTYIYGLLSPVDNLIHYVGRSIDPAKRLKAHLGSTRYALADNPKERWISSLKGQRLEPRLVILEALDTAPEYAAYERDPKVVAAELRWTERLLNEGHPLTNHERQQVERGDEDDRILREALERGREMFG